MRPARAVSLGLAMRGIFLLKSSVMDLVDEFGLEIRVSCIRIPRLSAHGGGIFILLFSKGK